MPRDKSVNMEAVEIALMKLFTPGNLYSHGRIFWPENSLKTEFVKR